MANKFRAMMWVACVLFASSFAQSSKPGEVERKISETVREIVFAYQKLDGAKYRNNIAVLDFEENSEAAKKKRIGFAVSELLATKLAQTSLLRIVERKQLEKALQEIALGMTGVVDEKRAQEAGRILGADMIVIGSVSELENFFNINIRLLETETGTVLTASTLKIEKPLMIESVQRMLLKDYGVYKGVPKYRIALSFQTDPFFKEDDGPSLFPYLRINYEIAPALVLGVQAGIAGDDSPGSSSGFDNLQLDSQNYLASYHGVDFDIERFALISLKSVFGRAKKVSPTLGVGLGVAKGLTYYSAGNYSTMAVDDSETTDAIEKVVTPIIYPFVGIDFARNRALSLSIEAGYIFGTKQITKSFPFESYGKDVSDISVQWKHIILGGALQFYF